MKHETVPNENSNHRNKTFTVGRTSTNACVGLNGIQDHKSYYDGYDEATRLLIGALKRGEATLDTAIYPLVFCARHRLELFLKNLLYSFTHIRESRLITEKKLNNTHDLSELWDLVKLVAGKTDKRFQAFVIDAQEYIIDFANIDPKGETFRYPYDKYKTLHLEQTSIINVEIFEKRYQELTVLMDECESLTFFLGKEYRTGTYTAELSRQDLHGISTILPHRDEWGLESFDQIRLNLKTKFNLGSNKLSKAIKLVESHREFASNIGIEIPIPYLNVSQLETFFSIYDEAHVGMDFSNATIVFSDAASRIKWKKLNEHMDLFVQKLIGSLSLKSIICLYSLYHLGHINYYSEEFDWLLEDFLTQSKNKHLFAHYCSTLINNNQVPRLIFLALKKLGQESLEKACLTLNSEVSISNG